MGKFKTYIKKNLTAVVVVAIVFVVAIVSMFLTGGKFSNEIGGSVTRVKLGGLMFGSSIITQTETNGYVLSVEYNGGVSYYGIASFVILVVGIVFLVLDTFFYGKKFDVVGFGFLVISGLLSFIILEAGSTVTIWPTTEQPHIENFARTFGAFHPAVGVYVYGLTNILCGIVGLIIENPLRYSIKRTKKRKK